MPRMRYRNPIFAIEITNKRDLPLLRFIFSNALANIATRDQYSKLDKDAMDYIKTQLEELDAIRR